jgi:hypothetical protein
MERNGTSIVKNIHSTGIEIKRIPACIKGMSGSVFRISGRHNALFNNKLKDRLEKNTNAIITTIVIVQFS